MTLLHYMSLYLCFLLSWSVNMHSPQQHCIRAEYGEHKNNQHVPGNEISAQAGNDAMMTHEKEPGRDEKPEGPRDDRIDLRFDTFKWLPSICTSPRDIRSSFHFEIEKTALTNMRLFAYKTKDSRCRSSMHKEALYDTYRRRLRKRNEASEHKSITLKKTTSQSKNVPMLDLPDPVQLVTEAAKAFQTLFENVLK